MLFRPELLDVVVKELVKEVSDIFDDNLASSLTTVFWMSDELRIS
ncbi:MAG: hypothetical protein ACFFB3_12510 [Candidatus Hodarchaeota archaeon]